MKTLIQENKHIKKLFPTNNWNKSQQNKNKVGDDNTLCSIEKGKNSAF